MRRRRQGWRTIAARVDGSPDLGLGVAVVAGLAHAVFWSNRGMLTESYPWGRDASQRKPSSRVISAFDWLAVG